MKNRNRRNVLHLERLESRQLLALSVTNLPATEIQSNSAIIGAEIIDDGGGDANLTVYWGDHDAGTDVREWDQTESLGFRALGQHRVPLANLNAGTDYFYRAFVFGLGGFAWSNSTASFRTDSLPSPTVRLQGPSIIGDSSARLSGTVQGNGVAIDELKVFYGTSDAGNNAAGWEQSVEASIDANQYTTSLSHLKSGTQYFARARAASLGGISWSEVQTFTTVSVPRLRISEIMAANATTLPTRIRLHADDRFVGPKNSYDWIEIQNGTQAQINMGGYYLTDAANEPTKWQFPGNTIVPANGSIAVLASSKDIQDVQLDEQGLLHTNFSLNQDGEFLALLDASQTVIHEFAPGYPTQQIDVSTGFFGTEFGPLQTPTPGEPNATLAPTMRNVVHEMAADQSLIVSAFIDANLHDVTEVRLTYRAMFDAERSVTMQDDGEGVDKIAQDGIFSASIPAGIAEAGEMIRYFVSATNVLGAATRFPRFLDDSASPEYFGTMIADSALRSDLPIFHHFLQTPNRADTDRGTRASVFYNGEFYDNVFIRIRGGTARSWPKRSYKIEFNDLYHFQYQSGLPRVDEFNLNATYTDKAYTRATLAYELYEDTGGAGPVTFPIRVERNGDFFSVALFVEQPDRDFLRRNDLNPDGALYKSQANRLNGLTGRAAGFFDKKTRREEDFADLQALIDGLKLKGEELERFLFDNVNLPAQINLMAVNLILQNIDATDKNYFIYRDTNGSDEWQMLPWDLDLVLGPNALNTDNIVYNEESPPAHTSHPYLGTLTYPFHGRKNHLFDAVVENPRTHQMFLRRVRTLMDDFLGSSATPEQERYFEKRIDELIEVLGPDVLLDKEEWGRNTHFAGRTYTLEEANDRIKTEYLAPRRVHLFDSHNIDRLQVTEITTLVPEFSQAQFLVPTNNDLGTGWTHVNDPSNIAEWTTGQLGFGFGTTNGFADLINTVVTPAEQCDRCTSVFVRIPFTLDDPASLSELTLRMKYDDGFVAYINGVRIADRNLRMDDPGFDSRASSHRNNLAVKFENINLSGSLDSVSLEKENILAIHLLNSSATSRDMLLSAELVEGILPDDNAVGIPNKQPDSPSIGFGEFDQDPQSGNQDEEFIEIKNEGETAIDISGWRLAGGVSHLFAGGTVINAGESLYVTPSARAFRNRQTGPSGGMGLFVQGGYQGHLSNFGETVELRDRDNQVVAAFQAENKGSAWQQFLRITELYYNPSGDDESTEFIELQNISAGDDAVLLNLDGVIISDGPAEPFRLGNVSIAAGDYLLVAKSRDDFLAGFPHVDPNLVIGDYDGSLSNSGERVKIEDPQGNTIVDLTYDDSRLWPQAADGVGTSLELKDVHVDRDQFGKSYHWQSSTKIGGTPAQPLSQSRGIQIHEVLSNPIAGAGQVDSIELTNVTQDSIDIGGWYLSDSEEALLKYQIPNNTVLNPGGFIVFDESQFNSDPNPANHIELRGTRSGELLLTIADQNRTTEVVDFVRFKASRAGESLGRFGYENLFPLKSITLGEINSEPRMGDVIISEFHYHPQRTQNDGFSADDFEFVEVLNSSENAIDISKWELDGALAFAFPDDSVIAPGGTMVVVPFEANDVGNRVRRDVFLNEYNVPGEILLTGGYSGNLSDSQESLLLKRFDANNDGALSVEDEVVYDDLAPWPTAADGEGMSLHRRHQGSFGNDPISWLANAPSPGSVEFAGGFAGDFNGDAIVNVTDVDLLCQAILTNQTEASWDLNDDQTVNQDDLQFLIVDVLETSVGDANLDGVFNSRDLVLVFLAGEYEDAIALNSTWENGDWNCDGDFTSSDLVVALQSGAYSQNASPQRGVVAAALDDEPSQHELQVEQHKIQTEDQNANLIARKTNLTAMEIDSIFRNTRCEPDLNETGIRFVEE